MILDCVSKYVVLFLNNIACEYLFFLFSSFFVSFDFETKQQVKKIEQLSGYDNEYYVFKQSVLNLQ